MSKTEKILIAAAVTLAAVIIINYYVVNSKTKKIISHLTDPTVTGTNLPTTLVTSGNAINNVGNIKKSGVIFQGEINSPSQIFKSFDSLAYGYRAMIQLLRNYYHSKNLKTLRQILEVYAPSSDNNNPVNYTNYVSEMTGINPNADLGTILYSEKVQLIIGAMSKFEQGSGFPINPVAIRGAYNMVGNGLIENT